MIKKINPLALVVIGLFAVIVLSAFGPVLSQSATAIICRFESTACVESWGSNIVVYPGAPNATMTPSFKVVATSGAVSGNVMNYPTPNQSTVCGTTTVTGTSALTSSTHGMSTPVAASVSLAEDVVGDGARVSYTNATGTITLKVWNSAATPAASSAGHVVAWCVRGYR